MASAVLRLSLALPLLFFLAAFAIPDRVAAVTPREYESMQRVLRGHGYNLVCNAMATSDLQWLLLTLPADAAFTVFSPTDAALFALDMTQTAASYTDTLRLHVVPLHLSLANLRSLAVGSILPTLLPSSALRLVSTRPLTVSGIDVVLPGLLYSRHVSVHGLGGIFSLASIVPYGAPPSAPKADPMAATDSNRTDLSSKIAPSSAADTGSPSPKADPMAAADSNRADLASKIAPSSAADTGSPSPKADPMAAADSNRTNLASEIAPSSASTESPSPITPPEHEISPEAAISASMDTSSPLSADSVAEKARALLVEISSVITDADTKSKSKSDVDQILDGESPPLMKDAQPEVVVNTLEKCGALDEMAIDCFVPESAAGLEHSSFHQAVRILT